MLSQTFLLLAAADDPIRVEVFGSHRLYASHAMSTFTEQPTRNGLLALSEREREREGRRHRTRPTA